MKYYVFPPDYDPVVASGPPTETYIKLNMAWTEEETQAALALEAQAEIVDVSDESFLPKNRWHIKGGLVKMLTFETPFHDMCASHTGILYKLDHTIESVYFDHVQLSKCPDAIVSLEGRFKYKGVSDGQAIYVQVEEVEAK